MNTIRKDLNTWGKIFAVVLALTLIMIAPVFIRYSRDAGAQPSPQVGEYGIDDYRSTGSGDWTDPSTWEVCTEAEYIDGEWVYTWTPAITYPGELPGDEYQYSVTIQSGHVIEDNNAADLYFGNLLVAGHLNLSNDLNLVNTEYVLVDGRYYDGSDITTGGSIRWLAKATLTLHANAVLNVINVKYTSGESIGEVIVGLGLHAPHAQNNNMRLRIGDIDYAAGEGGGNVVYIFDDINAAGGALQAIAIADPEDIYYIGDATEYTTTLTGDASGLGSGPDYTTFEWTGTGPNGFSISYNGQNPGVVDLVNGYGTYTFKLTVTSNYRDFIYSHYHEVDVRVHQAPLTITALDQTKEYGETFNFEGTEFTVEGLIDSDTADSVTLTSDGAAASAVIGTYAIIPSQAEGTGLGNYEITYVNGTLTVIKPILTITANDLSKIYGETTTFTGTEFTVDGLRDGDTVDSVTLSCAGAESPANTGGYAIIPSAADGTGLNNYTIVYEAGNLTVNALIIEVSADPMSKTYGDADPEFTYTYSPELIGTDTFSGELARVAGENVGFYAINQGTLALSTDYVLEFTGADLTINALTIEVSADPMSKTYGDADPEFTYTYSPELIGTDTFSGELARVAGENVGFYAINQGTLALSANYVLEYTGADLTIDALTVEVSADPMTKTYGDADPEFTYTYSPELIGSDTFSGELARVAGEDVGFYAINQGTLALSPNYVLNFTGAYLTIDPLTVYVTYENQSKTYGDPDPELTYSYTDMIGDDTLNIELTREAGEDAGDYAIIQEGATAQSSNYILEYTGGYLTITPLTIDVTADAQSKTYGDPDPELTYSYSQQLVGDDTLTIALTRETGENVGTYAITQGAMAQSTNYNLIFTGADLTITPLTIDVTVDAQSKTYGDPDPELTYSYSQQLVGNDTLTIELTREAGENAGTYAITQGAMAQSTNYNLIFTEADLTINPLVIQVTADPLNKTFGEADPAFTYTYSPELIGNDTFTGSLAREAGEKEGTYTINQGTLALNPSYILSYTGANLTIIEIPAVFELSDLVITPSSSETWAGITFTRDTNKDVLVTVAVSNMGGQSGTFHGVLKLNGEEVSSEDITLEPGESRQLTFNVSDLPTGDYTVEVEELSGEFSRDNWVNWWLISTLILTIVFIGYLIKRYGIDKEKINWAFEVEES